MKITVREVGFFTKIMKLFGERERLTLEIDSESVKMSLAHLNSYYVNLEASLFEIEEPGDVSFTVNPSLVAKNLHFFRSGLSMEVGTFFILRNFDKQTTTEVKIPLNKPEEYEYALLEASTKVLLKNIAVIKYFTGITTYEAKDNMLVLTKTENEVRDILAMEDVEWLQAGDLYFSCNNDWVRGLDALGDYIEAVLMEFSAYVLSVKFLFKKFHESYLEIQVPKNIHCKAL